MPSFYVLGPDQWAIHVPLGKLKTERMVSVDSLVATLVQHLHFLRFPDSRPLDRWLLAGAERQGHLRFYLHQVCHSLDLSTRMVPSSFGTTTQRKGFSPWPAFPA